MDPTANLREQRALSRDILALVDGGDDPLTPAQMDTLGNDAAHLAELVQALDQWITRGGFLPQQWRK